MNKTIIYSCGKGMTSRELLETTKGRIDAWFPELCDVDYDEIPMPRTEDEQLGLCTHLRGKTFVTVSEIIILTFLRKIRLGDMRTDELELYCAGRRIEVDVQGDMLDHWDGGFFEAGFNLRFH
ncbi:MAG: hypothetical protein ACYS7Y_11990 [Planctomycetota bacterium]|jgi:hypothetical protein